jgi:hypothetical protein
MIRQAKTMGNGMLRACKQPLVGRNDAKSGCVGDYGGACRKHSELKTTSFKYTADLQRHHSGDLRFLISRRKYQNTTNVETQNLARQAISRVQQLDDGKIRLKSCFRAEGRGGGDK